MTYRIVFMGSPDFAVPVLHALIQAPDFEVVGVVSQPDRPAGRGSEIKAPSVKLAAQTAGIEVYQPEKLRGAEALAHLKNWQADVHVVAAYGQILKPDILAVPPHGSINVHASLLPRWRGAAPIQAVIRAGDPQTGITIMQMDAGLDTGAMLLAEAISLDPRETAATLHDKLAAMAGDLLLRTLRGFLKGEITPQPQDDSLATFAPQIEKEEGKINWSQSALEIDRHVRAFTPWPGTFTEWNGKLLKIIAGENLPGSLAPGTVAAGKGSHPIWIGTGEGIYAPSLLQLAGKKQVSAADFLNGGAELINSKLG
jgi:methionyl-tRNA formyltransferase